MKQFPDVYQPSSDCGSFRSSAVTGFKITPKDVLKLVTDAERSGYERGLREAAQLVSLWMKNNRLHPDVSNESLNETAKMAAHMALQQASEAILTKLKP